MHSSAGQRGRGLNTDTVTTIGAALDPREKIVRHVSIASVGSLHAFHPPAPILPGHDADRQSLRALDRRQAGL